MKKIIKNFFDSNRKHFQHGGKFSKFEPVFDAFETIFFVPEETTSGFPHVKDALDLKRFMSIVILAIMPCMIFGIYNSGRIALTAKGMPANILPSFMEGLVIFLPLLIISYSVGLFWEGLFSVIRGHKVSEGFLVTGLLYPLILPPTMPLWQAAVGISFGVIIGKEVFGGTGRNILNPALTARAFLFFAYPASMSGDSVWIKNFSPDAVTGATALAVSAAAEKGSDLCSVLSQNGYDFSSLFFGFTPGSIGETSALLCLAGGLFLIITGVASFQTIIGGVCGAVITALFLNLFSGVSDNPYLSLNPLYHLVMGGFAFGIVFMATDPVSSPGIRNARWIYGFLIGMLTVLIRVFNPAYPEGTMLAILFMNLFAPLLDYYAIKFRLKKRITNV
ncbi:MAG: NADH:ubiquinone reductase (Na(+)-transporting) subunit B [Desulfobacteraceae bacterium]|nr:NADH:ubiquinone reductase (Na(+)-transporting) subunit B [Desulfobacteraceae bacterium]